MLSGGLRTKGINKQPQENTPLITVVTVVRNGEDTLEETILSVIKQTYMNMEYIIVDGASTDNTLDIIKKYEDRIDYWMSEPDQGIYNAMNKGIDLAMGEWINFMNSGDRFFSPTTMHDLFIRRNIDNMVDIIYGDVLLHYAVGSYIYRARPLNSILNYPPFTHQSSFVKLQLMKDIKFDETYIICGDYNFFYNSYLEKRVFFYVAIVIAMYNAEYGMSHNYKVKQKEYAHIRGVENSFLWKICFPVNYVIYLVKCLLKKILPRNIVKVIRRIREMRDISLVLSAML